MTILEKCHSHAVKMRNENKGQRYGQSLMNALFMISLRWYSEIHSTDADPFYDDSKIEAFNQWITNKEITEPQNVVS